MRERVDEIANHGAALGELVIAIGELREEPRLGERRRTRACEGAGEAEPAVVVARRREHENTVRAIALADRNGEGDACVEAFQDERSDGIVRAQHERAAVEDATDERDDLRRVRARIDRRLGVAAAKRERLVADGYRIPARRLDVDGADGFPNDRACHEPRRERCPDAVDPDRERGLAPRAAFLRLDLVELPGAFGGERAGDADEHDRERREPAVEQADRIPMPCRLGIGDGGDRVGDERADADCERRAARAGRRNDRDRNRREDRDDEGLRRQDVEDEDGHERGRCGERRPVIHIGAL